MPGCDVDEQRFPPPCGQVSSRTTHVIVPRDLGALQRAVARWLPAASDNDSSGASVPPGVSFVTPEYASECLSQRARLPIGDFAVDVGVGRSRDRQPEHKAVDSPPGSPARSEGMVSSTSSEGMGLGQGE